MTADDFETDKVESTSTESLKSGGSNVRYINNSYIIMHKIIFLLLLYYKQEPAAAAQEPPKEGRGGLMEEYSDRSLVSQSSQGSLEDAYIDTLRQLSMVMCIDSDTQLPTVESEMYSEPPEPYFTMSPEYFETDVANSASVEALKIETTNVSFS